MKLDQPWNIVDSPLKYHRGRHAIDYHEWALNKIKVIDDLANGNRSKFLELMESNIKSKLLADPNILNKK